MQITLKNGTIFLIVQLETQIKNSTMKISTKLHGALDYFTAFLLITSPWIFHFEGSIHAAIAVSIGIFTILNNVLTDYEYGLFRVIKMEFHLAIDIFFATALLTSSWLFNASESVVTLFLTLSIIQAVTSFITNSKPYAQRRTNNFRSLKINIDY